ncbi:MAG: DNA mismatch repair protein MutS [Alphaproteobacteria bacterium MarineAlpha11_Bin1]|nr:MAG: DNA mismatch repair protein MutS [Alphaproteobacteria bacterium MarineAlpha11_Bin1]
MTEINKSSESEAKLSLRETPDAKPTSPASTPMMNQYLEIKRAHTDALLFYRMGDFYEMFFEDAEKAADALDITLTKRGKHEGADIPMCGVPVHAAESYLSRLITKGFRVAVCEQTEDPAEAKKRGSKAVVRREVLRVVTPGTITEDTLLDARRHNYLAAIADVTDSVGLAWLDVSTGAFFAQPLNAIAIGAALARIEPGELLVPERLINRPEYTEVFSEFADVITLLPNSRFDSEAARKRLQAIFEVKALDSFGDYDRAEISAAGAVVGYVELTQKGKLPKLQRPRRLGSGETMEIDAATRRNLELVQTMSGDRKGSLLSVIDRTVTGPGGRLLAARIAAPLTDVEKIRRRHEAVAWFVSATQDRDIILEALQGAPDMERALSRLTLGRGSPRDLGAIRDGLIVAATLRGKLNAAKNLVPGVAEASINLGENGTIIEKLKRALDDNLPMISREGGFIRGGYAPELDEQRQLRDESRKHIVALQSRYACETGIGSLKIRHNKVLGYFIEVTSAQAEKIPTGDGSLFIHRQTLVNATRFTTVELGELEGKFSRAGAQALALEHQLFGDLVAVVTGEAAAISLAADSLARLDVYAALADLASVRGYTLPRVDETSAFKISGGRHPVVEEALTVARENNFIANDCDLAESQRLWLVTGPNMAGKSTFLRQNALIAILAQAGSFVPADDAHIGVVDRLFSRVGAADDLARGRSTFMVEMVETATILNQATDRSLVILDEIGRGTATFDGLSIAWATLENLHQVNRCRALFATHFHELTSLTSRLDALSCYSMRVKEWEGDVVFLHEVISGAADRSYGVHVAKLAGLPPAVVSRAEEVLCILEEGEQSGSLAGLAEELPLFSIAAQDSPPMLAKSAVEEMLSAINPDELTPRDALEFLYRLKALREDE